MAAMENIFSSFGNFFKTIYFPQIHVPDIIEIIIIAIVLYQVMGWFKKSRAWTLFKGIAVLALCWLVAAIFDLNTILWIFRNSFTIIHFSRRIFLLSIKFVSASYQVTVLLCHCKHWHQQQHI